VYARGEGWYGVEYFRYKRFELVTLKIVLSRSLVSINDQDWGTIELHKIVAKYL